MTQPNRLTRGGRIDRTAPLKFLFDGKPIHGYEGDTVASALIGNGVTLVGRSFKYHRPRGIVSAGTEEPNAFVQLGRGRRTLPNRLATLTRATDGLEVHSVNAWPTLQFDVMAALGFADSFIPAGFYYKTLMWPRRLWPLYERVLRRAAGLGTAPTQDDPDRYDHTNAHCDVLVVGAGPSGLAAALAAARHGARVILADEQDELGGDLVTIDSTKESDWISAAVAELCSMSTVTLLPKTTVFGLYESNLTLMLERRYSADTGASGSECGSRIWRVLPRRIVLATGAHERPLIFPNNDRPGVMLAGAISTYIKRYAVVPGSQAAIFTNNNSAYRAAFDLEDVGVRVAAIVDVRYKEHDRLFDEAQDRGIQVHSGSVVSNVRGRGRVNALGILSRDGVSRGEVECDLVGVSGGWTPALQLHGQAGGHFEWDSQLAAFVPEASNGIYPAGAVIGGMTTETALAQGTSAGIAAAEERPESSQRNVDVTSKPSDLQLESYGVPPGDLGAMTKQFVDFHEDVTLDDLRLALREGFESIEHVKRYTTLGMGPDQGKIANSLATIAVAELRGVHPASVGTPRHRPAYTPIAFGAIAGRVVGALSDPVRVTPMQVWHETAGARFENVGQWQRAWYYPRSGESMAEAVARECVAVRRRVGIMDYSTLGKIEVTGPDAGELLDRVYVNRWKDLQPGRCQYGLMLGEDGMILDDGVAARLDDSRYLLFTTTTGAATVLNWLERWLQTEWRDLQVYLTSVSEQWSNIVIAGPNSRKLLAAVGTDIPLEARDFPFMACRDGKLAGVASRVFRISFSGELSYEINIAADEARHVWEALVERGDQYGLTPYGTEALHVLRAEKGFIIVGQETDGSVTPDDVGLGRMVSRRKDFIGKRSLSRDDLRRSDRKQLVGLQTDDPAQVLPEGGPVVDVPGGAPPVPMRGHVTSSYFSAVLDRSIALALVGDGRSKLGEQLFVATHDDDWIPVRSCSPMFYDPKGLRQRG